MTGTCFCRAVRYEVADAFRYAMNCHCSNCRRTTGSAFKPFAGIEREKFAVTQGADKLMIYGDDKANDTHCRRCGSLLFSVVRDGAFVQSPWARWWTSRAIRPARHIFVGSKAPWFTITDDLPQFAEHAV